MKPTGFSHESAQFPTKVKEVLAMFEGLTHAGVFQLPGVNTPQRCQRSGILRRDGSSAFMAHQCQSVLIALNVLAGLTAEYGVKVAFIEATARDALIRSIEMFKDRLPDVGIEKALLR